MRAELLMTLYYNATWDPACFVPRGREVVHTC
jgi:hypothetical protein